MGKYTGEDKSGFRSTPGNTLGFGNPMLPGGYIDSRKNGGKGIGTSAIDFHKQKPGSGDKI